MGNAPQIVVHHILPAPAPAGPDLQHPTIAEPAPKPRPRDGPRGMTRPEDQADGDVESSETTVDNDDSTMAETQGNMSTAPQATNMTPALPVSEWDRPVISMPAENFRRMMKELPLVNAHYFRTLRRKQQVQSYKRNQIEQRKNLRSMVKDHDQCLEIIRAQDVEIKKAHSAIEYAEAQATSLATTMAQIPIEALDNLSICTGLRECVIVVYACLNMLAPKTVFCNIN